MNRRPWRDAEIGVLRDMWKRECTGEEIGRILGRSKDSVLAMVRRIPDLNAHRPGPRKGRYAVVEVGAKGTRCPCCGGKIEAPPELEGLEHIQLAKTPRRILEALIKSYPDGVGYSELADKVYWDSPSGGPTNYNNTLAVTVSKRLRPKLEQLGWSVGLNGNYQGIRLFKLSDAKEAA